METSNQPKTTVDDKEFLLALKKQIETSELMIESEFGHLEKVEEMIKAGKMPAVYFEVVRRLEEYGTE